MDLVRVQAGLWVVHGSYIGMILVGCIGTATQGSGFGVFGV